MDCCLLCLELSNNAIRADSEKWQKLNIKQVLEKHFWPLNSVDNSALICLTCWQEVDDFHKFYRRIEDVHTHLKKLKKEEDTVEYKIGGENFEYCFQEPEIIIQQTESTDTVEEKKGFFKGSTDDLDICTDNNIDYKDPLGTTRKRRTSKLKNTDISNRKRLKRNTSLDKKIEEDETKIKKEVTDSDENSKPDSCDESDYDDFRDANYLPSSDSKEKKNETEKGHESSDKHRVKRQDNDKFIAEHFKKMACDLCQAPFKDFPTLQKHFMKSHNQRGYVVCCKRKFSYRTRLVDHLLCHENPDYYKCKECGKSMSERKGLRNHMLRVHRANEIVKKHACDVCGKAFVKACGLREHMLTHLPEEEKKFPCLECGKKYASAYLLNLHQQAVHLKRFAKICDICGRSFNSNVELKAHINRHEGIPPPILTCDVCGLRLTTKRGLKLHQINQHPVGGKKDHHCPICAKVSPNLAALQKHISRVHMHGNSYDHKCAICEKAFKRAETLKEHMAAHTGNALYTCQWCPMTFNSSGNMYSHRKKMHPKEWEEAQLQKYATNIPVERK